MSSCDYEVSICKDAQLSTTRSWRELVGPIEKNQCVRMPQHIVIVFFSYTIKINKYIITSSLLHPLLATRYAFSIGIIANCTPLISVRSLYALTEIYRSLNWNLCAVQFSKSPLINLIFQIGKRYCIQHLFLLIVRRASLIDVFDSSAFVCLAILR